jgi:hypothetical protein
METQLFKQTISSATYRENIVGSSLSRRFKMCINFSPFPKDENFRKTFDYLLFDPMGDKPSMKIEQQDSFQITDETSGEICMELATYTSEGETRGKLHYSTCDIFCLTCPYIEKVYLFKFAPFKQYIISLHESNLLKIFDSSNLYEVWKQKHDTNPVRLCYLDLQQTLYDLRTETKVYTFSELGILQPLTKQF